MKTPPSTRKGFTLIEILLVVALIAVLSGIVILAINPTRQLGEARNAQRRADVNTILNAVYQYTIDNNGALPPSITTTVLNICTTGSNCTGYADLSVLTNVQKYLVSIPTDPTAANGPNSGYTIKKTDYGRVMISAPSAENSATINVTR